MSRFPYMNFPFPFYKNTYQNPGGFYSAPNPVTTTNKSYARPINNTSVNNCPKTDSKKSSNDIPEINHRKLNIEDGNKKNKSNNNTSDYLFDLFGLKIYSDDVLLISLIYFLYSEGVKDDSLFLVLVLLLLS